MKKTKRTQIALFTGIIAIAAIIGFSFAACDDDGNTTAGGVDDLLTAGLYDKAPPILKDDIPMANIEANDIAAAIYHVKRNSGTYTLLINKDVELEPQVIARSNLTIIGIGRERKINLSKNGNMFLLQANSSNGVYLTIGKNITLVGRSTSGNGNENNNDCVITINGSDSFFTMLDSSKITGNTWQVDPASTSYLSSAVYILNGGAFTLKGGTITGNAISGATSSQVTAGGLYVGGSSSSAFLEGGSITGNTGGLGDVLINPAAGSFILGKTAVVGNIAINAVSTASFAITIAQGWTGNVGKLHLRGNNTTMATVVGYWEGKTVLKAENGVLSSASIAKLNPGNFINSSTSFNTAPINETHKIESSGDNIGKLVKK